MHGLPYKSLLYMLIPLVSPRVLYSSILLLQSSMGWAVFLFLSGCPGFGWDRVNFLSSSWYSVMFWIQYEKNVNNIPLPSSV